MNGIDYKALNPDGKEPYFCGSVNAKNTKIDGNVLEQTIKISKWKDEEENESSDDAISIVYKDILIGGEVVKGEWTYDHTFEKEAYTEEKIHTNPIDITGTGIDNETYTLDSFAVTPNGLKVYGAIPEKQYDPEKETVYPCHTTGIHIKAWDNLGNEYLLYPRVPDYQEGAPEQQAIYEIYDGPNDSEDLPDELDPEASSITIVLEEEILTWTGPADISEDQQIISNEFTIDLTQ